MTFFSSPSSSFFVRPTKRFRSSRFSANALFVHAALLSLLTLPAARASAQTQSPTLVPQSAALNAISSTRLPAETSPNATSNAISIHINGRVVETDPAPVLRAGSVLVPLRGVLENLGATVTFNAKTQGILVTQGAKRVVLILNSREATVDGKSFRLAAAPQNLDGRTFVPLRSLAQLFGYGVQWIAATNTVSIVNASGAVLPTGNHRAALKAAGRLGVGISFVEGDSTVSNVEADRLLDAAQDAGASLIKMRFDWGVLEPKAGAPFNWAFYDRVIAGARRRGLTVEGVLGQSAPWASTFYKSSNPEQWRNGAPRDNQIKAWQNYVRRVVGRYKNDVHAWQVWEKPSADRFRSSQNVYRKFLLAAAQSACASDANAIVFAAEPGGLDLDVINALAQSEAAPFLDGVTVYPASQNQPGNAAPTGDFLRPYATLLLNPNFRGASKRPLRDFWIGGLSRPVLGENLVSTDVSAQISPAVGAPSSPGNANSTAGNMLSTSSMPSETMIVERSNVAAPVAVVPDEIATNDADVRARLLATFTAQAQADYLMQSSVLALAAGSEKVFWSDLRDRDFYESIAPINAEINGGLLRRDFSPRPSLGAFKTLSSQVKGKNYIGSLALGPNIVALVFDDGKNASVAAWTTGGTAPLVVNATGENPGVPNSLYIASVATTRVLDSSGEELSVAPFVGTLTTRPIWIENVAYETRNAVKKAGARGVLLDSSSPTFVAAQGVSANFSEAGNESGLYWRKFSGFRSAANEIVKAGDRTGLTTTVSRNVMDPAAGKFFIFLDVDDDYLFLTRDTPVEVTVVVQRPTVETQTLVNAAAGFNIEYSTANGTSRTPWQVVEAGDGWATYTFTLPNASFSNRGGYDLLINTFGSKKNLVFGSGAVRKKETSPAMSVPASN